MTSLLLAALIAVESGGDARAIGDGGRALGVLQIHAGVVQDVNRIAGRSWTHADAHRPEIAVQMAEIYLRHYVTPARLGRAPTTQDYARVWNGGPNGHRKTATLPYWRKVRRHLK